MSKFKVGDRVRLTGSRWSGAYPDAPEIITIESIDPDGLIIGSDGVRDIGDCGELYSGGGYACELADDELADAVNPSHYQFPNGAEVRFISEWLTANSAQALQYIARSSRIDGQNKGDALEDLLKARMFIDFELERLWEK